MSKKVIETVLSNPKNLDFVIRCSDGDVKTNSLLLRSAVEYYENFLARWTKNVEQSIFTVKDIQFMLDAAYYGCPHPSLSYYSNRSRLRDSYDHNREYEWNDITLEELFARHRILDFYGMIEAVEKTETAIRDYLLFRFTLQDFLGYIRGETKFPEHLSYEKIFDSQIQHKVCYFIQNEINKAISLTSSTEEGEKDKVYDTSIADTMELVKDFDGFTELFKYTYEYPSRFWKIYPKCLSFSVFNKYLPLVINNDDIELTKSMVAEIDSEVYNKYQKEIREAMRRYVNENLRR